MDVRLVYEGYIDWYVLGNAISSDDMKGGQWRGFGGAVYITSRAQYSIKGSLYPVLTQSLLNSLIEIIDFCNEKESCYETG